MIGHPLRPSAAWRLCWALLAFVLVLTTGGPARAQQPITLEASAAFEGAYRVGEWSGVTVRVANSGPDVRGRLEWRFPGESVGRFQQEIDLPNGAQKQVVLPFYALDFARAGAVVLVADNTVLAQADVRLEALDQDRALVTVVGSDAALLNSLGGLVPSGFSSTLVRHIEAAALPDTPQTLRAVNALFLYDADTAALSAAQQTALAEWVRLGGQLVVGGGGSAAQAAAGFADILPVELTGNLAQASLAPLAALGGDGGNGQLPADTTVAEVRPRPEATALFENGNTGLIYSRELGAGTVFFATFDLAALRGWGGELALWQQTLNLNALLSPGTLARRQQFSTLDDVLRIQALALPPTIVLLCLLVLYVAVIGPANYLILKRLGRLEWGWLTIPAVVVVFVVGIYLAGLGLRGGQSQISQIAMLQGSEGDTSGIATTYTSLFSPRRARYTLGFPAGTYVSELQSFDDPGSGAPIITGAGGVELRDALVDIAALRTLVTEASVENPVSVQSSLQIAADAVGGEVRNVGAQPLEDALLVQGRAFQPIGTLAPGGSTQVALERGVENFPWNVGAPTTEQFDRQQLLVRLFGSEMFANQGLLDPEGVYLLGWSSSATTPVLLNGEPAAPQAITLYIIRLNS